MEIDVNEYKSLAQVRKNKFNAKKVIYNNIEYDSTIEAKFSEYLDLLKNGNKIIDYKYHVVYPIEINGILICKYELDFLVKISSTETKHYDTKGFCKNTAYSLFRIKKKLMKAIHNIDVIEAVYDRKEKIFKYKL